VDCAVVSNRRRSTASRARKSATRTERRRAATERRRQFASRSARYEAQRRRRRRVLWASIGVVILLVAGGVTFLVLRDTGGSGEAVNATLTSPVVSQPASPFSISTVPTAYHVVYKIDTSGAQGNQTMTEDMTIQRPFNSKIVTKSGPPPGTTEQWTASSNLGLYADTSSGGSPQVRQSHPQTALGDFRLDATLTDLVSSGMFQTKERRTVLGRDCQVYRTGVALESFSTQAPTAKDYADVCIDSAGLMLEEVAVSSGKLSERLIATTVDDKAAPTADTFTISGTPTTIANGGSELVKIDAATAPAPGYWTFGTVPQGYTLEGRYRLRTQANTPDSTDPSSTTTTTVAGQQPPTADSYVDVYVNGTQTIVIQQGPPAAAPQNLPSTGATATVGSLGSVQTATDLTGSRLLAHPSNPSGWFVSVTGTVPMAALQQIGGTLKGS
jgi:hypothetical protein